MKRRIYYFTGTGNSMRAARVIAKAPLVKLMGLPEKRRLYRNPYISAQDLAKARERP